MIPYKNNTWAVRRPLFNDITVLSLCLNHSAMKEIWKSSIKNFHPQSILKGEHIVISLDEHMMWSNWRFDGSGWDGVNCDEWGGWSKVGLHEVLWAKASGVCRGAVGGVGWGEIKHVNWRGRIGAMGGEGWESSGNTREVWGEECSGWKICKVKTYENVP